MTRGGKREGSGRKSSGGIARRVSLTLSPEQWEMIDKSEQSISSFVRHLICENELLKMKRKSRTKRDGEN
ncbi:hypothetical protein AB4114_11235 [Paenibacillus sp. 2RAB27]|uniref:hypothetical protein n=1 Tax=Paenibacillus sp. 2RAB27 TaxID=3232991 RepID=UPI003F973305